MSQLIVTVKRGIGWYAFWIACLLALLVAVFYLGKLESKVQREALTFERDSLSVLVDDYEQKFITLEQQNILLESSAQVDAQASEKIVETIQSLQQNIDVLETELAFYRGIMAPEKDVKGLHIASFSLTRAAEERSYAFQLALTQVKSHDVFLTGKVQIVIDGVLNGQTTQYRLSEISSLTDDDLKFTFKYFQHIKGVIDLPEGFKAEKVRVEAKSSGRNGLTVNAEFPWQ